MEEAREIVARLLAGVPAGSFLVISHAGSDLFPDEMAAFEKSLNDHLPGNRHVARPQAEVSGFFEGTELLGAGRGPGQRVAPGAPPKRPPPRPPCGAAFGGKRRDTELTLNDGTILPAAGLGTYKLDGAGPAPR